VRCMHASMYVLNISAVATLSAVAALISASFQFCWTLQRHFTRLHFTKTTSAMCPAHISWDMIPHDQIHPCRQTPTCISHRHSDRTYTAEPYTRVCPSIVCSARLKGTCNELSTGTASYAQMDPYTTSHGMMDLCRNTLSINAARHSFLAAS
jgi:hypothetical protein